MTGPRDPDAEMTAFLVARAGPLPDRVFEHVDVAVRSTAQVRSAPADLPGQRRQLWNRAWLAAAAVVVLAIGLVTGSGLIPGLPGIWGPGGRPSAASPSPTPTATAASSLAPSESGGAAPTPAGLWGTIDDDGSPLTLSVSMSGSAWAVAFTDLRATTCGGEIALGQGPGSFVDNVLTYEGIGGCEGQPPGALSATSFTFDPAADTLTQVDTRGDSPDVVYIWRRGPPPPDAFDGLWTAVAAPGRQLSLDGAGLVRNVRVAEVASALCDGQPYDASGTGSIGTTPGEGRFLTVALTGGCPGASGASIIKFEYLYNTNTLLGPLSEAGAAIATTINWER